MKLNTLRMLIASTPPAAEVNEFLGAIKSMDDPEPEEAAHHA